jgi:hypothetical protein
VTLPPRLDSRGDSAALKAHKLPADRNIVGVNGFARASEDGNQYGLLMVQTVECLAGVPNPHEDLPFASPSCRGCAPTDVAS